MNKIIYAGSFDPITNGHSWLVDQALELFDEVVILIANNVSKKYYFSLEERQSFIEHQFKGKKVSVVILQNEYVAQYAKDNNIKYMLRGLRNSVDFEYETDVYNMNQIIAPEIKTIYLRSPAHITEISSSKVKSLVGFPRWKKHIESWVNSSVISCFSKKIYADKLKPYWDSTIFKNTNGFDLILNSYSEPQRYYHTLEHVLELCEKVKLVDIQDKEAILATIFFHDIIYDPRSRDNEEKSVEIWEHFAKTSNVLIHENFIKKVSDYILATKTHTNANNDQDLDTFLDLDLSILGSDKNRFQRYEEEIRWEYSFVPEEIYNQERSKIMKKLSQYKFKNKNLKKIYSLNLAVNLNKY